MPNSPTTPNSDPASEKALRALAQRFPADFLWGTSTSAYQIEGAVDEDGRGPTIWDTFAHTPGRVVGGETGDIAGDHYHRWREDIEVMAELGLSAYSLTIAWSRLLPEGQGRVEPRGVAFYRQLLQGLNDAGITPLVTLYHWDLPQALQDRGGWANRDTVDAFVAYARLVLDELGDLVEVVKTINEPWCAAFLGHGSGVHAPGITDPRTSLRAAHHLLLGHGEAIRAMRELGGEHRFGLVPNLYGIVGASDSDADQRAVASIDMLQNLLWLDATLEARYPDELLAMHERFRVEVVRDGDLERIAAPMDVLGVNFYGAFHVRGVDGPGTYDSAFPGTEHVAFDPPPEPWTAMDWGVEPEQLTALLTRLDERYDLPPIIINENGAAYNDVVADDGSVHDEDRRRFIERHLDALADAMDAGVDVRGYFVWSLLDNFEWAEGYAKRFGLVRIEPGSLQRTVKHSGRWYAALIETWRAQHR